MLKPVLLILHQEHSSPGRVGQTLAKLGYPLDVRRPRFGDPLPETMDDHAGAVIFGGPQSANDNEEFMHREIDWIQVPLRDKKPYLGMSWRTDASAPARRSRFSTPRRSRRGRLLRDPANRGRTQGVSGLARSRLSMASRRFRPS